MTALVPYLLVIPNEFGSLSKSLRHDDFDDKLIFSDETTFHLTEKVNRHNVRFWGTENPRTVVTIERESSKVKVFRAISKIKGRFSSLIKL